MMQDHKGTDIDHHWMLVFGFCLQANFMFICLSSKPNIGPTAECSYVRPSLFLSADSM